MAVHVLSQLLKVHLPTDGYEAAIETGRKLLKLDPLRENTHRALMKAHASNGQSAKSLLLYKDLSEHLHRELQVDPEPETVSLANQIRRSREIGSQQLVEDHAPNPCTSPVQSKPKDPPKSGSRAIANIRHVHTSVAGSVFAALMLATFSFNILSSSNESTESPDPAIVATNANTRPTIAVMPFDDLTPGALQTISADGFSEDLTIGLAGIPGLDVVARRSSFQYRHDVDIKEVGRKLNAMYVVDGSVRQVGSTYRISAQLIDTRTGHYVWANYYDKSSYELTYFRDNLNSSIVEELALRIGFNELSLAAKGQPANIQAYQAFLSGKEQFSEQTPEDLAKAIESFKRALSFDPNFAQAEAALANAYLFAYIVDWSSLAGLPFRSEAYKMAIDRANNALKKEYPPALAYTVLAKAAYFSRARSSDNYHDAIVGAQQAIFFDPAASGAFLGLGQILVRGGEPARAIAQLELARRLDPSNAGFVDFDLALAYFNMERFDLATRHIEQSLAFSPEGYLSWTLALVIYLEAGNEEKAKFAFNQALKLREQQGKGLLRSNQPPGAGTFLRQSDEARLRSSMFDACKRFALGHDI